MSRHTTVWASILAATIGCGGGLPADPDAAPDAAIADAAIADAVPDAMPDAMPASVVVHVRGRAGAGPSAGVPVLFHDPAGALVGRTTTDAQGVASGVVAAGGSITVVEAGPRLLTTIAGVEPGDDLEVGDVGTWDPPLRATSIVVPSGPDASDQYVAWGPCALSGFSSTTTVPVTLWGCAPASGPVIAAAYKVLAGGQLGGLSGFVYAPQVALVDGGTASIAGPWSPPIPFTLAVAGLPADSGGGNVDLVRYGGGRQLYQYQSGSIAWTGSYAGTIQVAGGGDGVLVALGVDHGGNSPGHTAILDYRPGAPTSWTADVAAALITRPLDVVEEVGELAPGGPTGPTGVRWTMSGAGDHDGIVVRDEVVDANYDITRWTFVLPPAAAGARAYTYPALPPDLIPLWADRTTQFFTISAVETPAASYAAFRRDAEPQWVWQWMGAPTADRQVRIATTY
jgi:hypothetical protein